MYPSKYQQGQRLYAGADRLRSRKEHPIETQRSSPVAACRNGHLQGFSIEWVFKNSSRPGTSMMVALAQDENHRSSSCIGGLPKNALTAGASESLQGELLPVHLPEIPLVRIPVRLYLQSGLIAKGTIRCWESARDYLFLFRDAGNLFLRCFVVPPISIFRTSSVPSIFRISMIAD
jgi:hypothetical protein